MKTLRYKSPLPPISVEKYEDDSMQRLSIDALTPGNLFIARLVLNPYGLSLVASTDSRIDYQENYANDYLVEVIKHSRRSQFRASFYDLGKSMLKKHVRVAFSPLKSDGANALERPDRPWVSRDGVIQSPTVPWPLPRLGMGSGYFLEVFSDSSTPGATLKEDTPLQIT